MKTSYKVMFIGALALFSGVVSAATTVPNTFTGGTAASASEVNANFTALATAIDTLEARVAALENPSDVTLSGLVGNTYCVTNIGTISGQQANFGRFSSFIGNYVLTIDSTSAGTLNQLVDKEHELGLSFSTQLDAVITEFDQGIGTQAVTINSLTNGILSTDIGDFNLSSDGKAFTGISHTVTSNTDGENSFIVAIQCPVVP